MQNRLGWLSTVVVITCLIGTISWFCLNNVISAVEQVNHNHLIIESIQETLLAVTDIENGTRGYLITNDESFLEPYNRGIKAQQSSLDTLARLSKDDDGLKARINVLTPNILTLIQLCSKSVDDKKEGLDTGSDSIKNGQQGLSMNVVRGILSEMLVLEKEEVVKKREKTIATSKTVLFSAVAGIIGYCIIVTFVFPLAQSLRKS